MEDSMEMTQKTKKSLYGITYMWNVKNKAN